MTWSRNINYFLLQHVSSWFIKVPFPIHLDIFTSCGFDCEINNSTNDYHRTPDYLEVFLFIQLKRVGNWKGRKERKKKERKKRVGKY